MRVDLLGPFQISHDGVVVTPTAPKLRQVMAVLSVSANRLIRTDQLIDELWPEQPPASAMTTLQTYVYKLRKLMLLGNPSEGPDRATAVALTTRPSGYLLRLPDHAVDAGRFDELAHRGRAELTAGRLDSAAGVLREALDVWRGPAFTDVPAGPLLRTEIVRLEERRKSTLDLRVAADLRLGRYHDLIGELTNLVAVEPTHEGFQGKLMLALHLAGRRSDALRAYQRARDSLARELGLEPSAELQRLQRRILDSDATLESCFERPSVRVGPVEPPALLPPELPGLIGRVRQAGELHDLLGGPSTGVPPVVVVTGPPGVGSTALCLHAAHRARPAYPDGQFYAKLTAAGSGPLHAGDVLAAFLRGTGLPRGDLPDDLKERSGLFRSWTASRRVLVVLDDVADVDQLAPLLPTGPDCATLITTRRRVHSASVTRTVDLAPLEEADALALLVRELGSPRVRRQLADARELVEFCGGLPLALRSAAAVLRVRPHWPIAHVLRQDEHGSLLGVAASVRTTFELLPADVRDAVRALAPAATAPLTPAGAAAVLGTDARTAESVLECLVEHHLAEVVSAEADDFRYRVPPLVELALCAVGGRPAPSADPSVRRFA